MEVGQPSASAMSAAVARGTHRLWDEPPWIVDDPFALALVGPNWEQFAAASRGLVREQVWRQGHTVVRVRSRYPEDRLAEGGYGQYVILGAGLDSFAWRRPDLLGPLRVFEVDHPASQAWKRERAAMLGLPTNRDQIFVPLDFEGQDLRDCLEGRAFDWSCPTLFSCVGATMYLSTDSVAVILRVVARCERGAESVFSYNLKPEFMDDCGREFLAAITVKAAGQGEPIKKSFAPLEMEELIDRCGLTVSEHPTADDLCARYCANRHNGLRPFELERLIAARRLTPHAPGGAPRS